MIWSLILHIAVVAYVAANVWFYYKPVLIELNGKILIFSKVHKEKRKEEFPKFARKLYVWIILTFASAGIIYYNLVQIVKILKALFSI